MNNQFNELQSISYSAEDEARLIAFLKDARKKQCELSFELGIVDARDFRASLDRGVIYLSSRNWGYKFRLVNVDMGKGRFVGNRRTVQIYLSQDNRCEYQLLQETSTLSAALTVLEKAYRNAAQDHLA